MICFSHVTAGYRGMPILTDINLSVPEGQIFSLIGPNGCGKTTLLKTACGLLPPLSGEILFEGKPAGSLSRREFARLAAFLPQNRDVPSITVERFVSHGRYPHLSFGRSLTSEDREKTEDAMRKTGTLSLAHRELSRLSGGERQRVYLAMTLAQDAKILFLDEPTTYLDIGQKYEVMELIRSIRDLGKTVVMVLHDLSLAFSCSDETAVLGEGKLLISGPSQQVFDSGIPARVFGVSGFREMRNGRTEYIFSPARPD